VKNRLQPVKYITAGKIHYSREKSITAEKIAYKGDFKMELQEDIKFDAKITVKERISKNGNTYQVMVIGVENKKTGEILNIHEVYIKEHLRQIIEFIMSENKE
jgi:hypothetical protein